MPKISRDMTSSQQKKVHTIIHGASASAAAIGGGLANIPGSDAPALVALQTGMIISIGAVFNKKITESLAKSILADFLGVSVGKVIANVLSGWLPGIGNGINAATAAGLTELIGWTAANDFANETETLDKNAMEIIDKRVGDAANSLKKTKKTDTTKKKGFFKRK